MSTAERVLHAEWALWSETSPAESSVLVGSTPERAPILAERIERQRSTYPAGERPRPAWVSFRAAGGPATPAIGIGLARPAEVRDPTGQLGVSTFYAEVSYPNAAEVQATYRELALAVRDALGPGGARGRPPQPADWPLPLRLPAALEPPWSSLDDPLPLVKAAALAARLLEGPVLVPGFGERHLDKRLRHLDLVAALLPYGYRANLDANTWASPSQRDPRVRWAFGRSSLDVADHPTTGVARAYFRLLRRALENDADEILRTLWSYTTPCSFDDPGPALDLMIGRRRRSAAPVPSYPSGPFEYGSDDPADHELERRAGRPGGPPVPASDSSLPHPGPPIETDSAPEQEAASPLPRHRSDASSLLPPIDDDVQFTVYRPARLVVGQWANMLVFTHKSEPVVTTQDEEIDPLAEVERQAQAFFGGRMRDIRHATADVQATLTLGSALRIEVDLPGVRCDPAVAEISWTGPVHQIAFSLLASPTLAGETVRGWLRVWRGSLILGEASLAVPVVNAAPTSVAPTPVSIEQVVRYRKIFPSYSHRDQPIVEHFAAVVGTLGDRYLQDVLVLRAGEDWNASLLDAIGDADVFQLFWSHNSMHSRYCRQEWEWALRLKRPNFVRPVYWEEPLPAAPHLGLPPADLRRLHFARLPALANSAMFSPTPPSYQASGGSSVTGAYPRAEARFPDPDPRSWASRPPAVTLVAVALLAALATGIVVGHFAVVLATSPAVVVVLLLARAAIRFVDRRHRR